MYYVYLLESRKDNQLYTGYTSDLRRRFKEHNERKSMSTKNRAPFTLVYYEAYLSQADAKSREYRLKTSQGARTALRRRLPESLRGRLVWRV